MLFVVSHGLTAGGRASLAANAGILTANIIYFALSAMGLGAVLLASHTVFTALKYAGALYLIYLGIQTIRGSGLALPDTAADHPAERPWRVWTRATALQASNPKSLIFFTALLPQFIDTSKPVALQFLVLGVTSVVIEFLVLAAYGLLASSASRLAQQPRFRRLTDRVSGSFLILAGAGVALNRSR